MFRKVYLQFAYVPFSIENSKHNMHVVKTLIYVIFFTKYNTNNSSSYSYCTMKIVNQVFVKCSTYDILHSSILLDKTGF